MNAKQRRLQIVEITNSEKKVEVNNLAERFSASKETIRRDLVVLSEKSLLRKVHGGAAAIQTAIESPITSRYKASSEEKKKIADYAATLVKAGDSLFIDTGSTTYALCEGLCERGGLTIITNSLRLTLDIGNGSDHDIYLVGGQYSDQAIEVVGNLALDVINKFHCDHAFITVGAIDIIDGCMDFNMDEASIAQAMIKNASTVTILADHTKIGQKALCSVCDLSKVSRLITDKNPPREFVSELEKLGVELVVVD